jgi:hypothetical protein
MAEEEGSLMWRNLLDCACPESAKFGTTQANSLRHFSGGDEDA